MKFARFLPDYGWEPVVLTTSRFGESYAGSETVVRTGELFESLRGRKGSPEHSFPQYESNMNVRQSRGGHTMHSSPTDEIGTVESSNGSGLPGFLRNALKGLASRLMVPDSHILWTRKAYKRAKEMMDAGGIDLIYSSSPPSSSHILARDLKKATGVPWVMDMRDPWTLEPIERHLAGSASRMRIEKRMERSCFETADCIVVNTENAAREYRKLYVECNRKIVVITNGYDEEEMNEARRLEAERPIIERNDARFVMSHIGSFSRYLYRGDYPVSLLEAIRSLIDEAVIGRTDIEIYFVGNKSHGAAAKMESYNLGPTLHIVPPVTHIDALRYMISSDALLVYDPDTNGRLCVRGKVYEYLASGRRILALVPQGEMADLIRRTGAGIVCAPDDVACIRRALLRLFTEHTSTGMVISGEERSGRFAEDNILDIRSFERRALTGKLADCMNGVFLSRKA